MKEAILVVDGYNIIGAWPELVKLKNNESIEEARDQLLKILSNYAAFEGVKLIVVFDAQLVPGISKSYTKYALTVVFTAYGETADRYIEGMVDYLRNVLTEVTVATSDLAEQQVIFAKGASRISAMELLQEITRSRKSQGQETKRFQIDTKRERMTWDERQLRTLQRLRDKLR